MTRADVIARLECMEPALRASGVASLFLYGSYARDEARPDSDIDILVDFAGQAPSYVFYMGTYHQLEDAFRDPRSGSARARTSSRSSGRTSKAAPSAYSDFQRRQS